MKTENAIPPDTLRWLATHAGFPARRLPVKAELMLCAAAAAAEENRQEVAAGMHLIARKDPALQASQKALAMRRNRVHFKCDNSAKV